MDALLAILIPALPQLSGISLLLVFAIWRERAHNGEKTRWETERAALIAEKNDAMALARGQFAEDDARREKRITALIEENEALELKMDTERRARRMLEDQTQYIPRVERGQ